MNIGIGLLPLFIACLVGVGLPDSASADACPVEAVHEGLAQVDTILDRAAVSATRIERRGLLGLASLHLYSLYSCLARGEAVISLETVTEREHSLRQMWARDDVVTQDTPEAVDD